MAFLLSPIARYLAGAGVLLLAFLYWLHGHDAKVTQRVEQKYAAIAAKAEKQHQLELDDARKERLQHAADLATYIAAHPVQPVFLCPHPHLPPATVTETSAVTSPAPADVQPVPAGNIDAGAGGHTDVSGLLNLFAIRADETADDLREQQAVK